MGRHGRFENFRIGPSLSNRIGTADSNSNRISKLRRSLVHRSLIQQNEGVEMASPGNRHCANCIGTLSSSERCGIDSRERGWCVDFGLACRLLVEVPDCRRDWQGVVKQICAYDDYSHPRTTDVLLSSSEHCSELQRTRPTSGVTRNSITRVRVRVP